MSTIGTSTFVGTYKQTNSYSHPPSSGSIGNRARARSKILERIRHLGRRALPPFPGTSTIPQVIVPPPASMEACSDLDAVRFLANAYRTVIGYRFDTISRFLEHGDLRNHKMWVPMLRAYRQFLAEDIPPVAWVDFSIDVWGAHHSRPPPAKFVFSAKRIRDRASWFEGFRDDYCVARSVIGAHHKALVADWHAMMTELIAIDPQDRRQILDAVDKYFPGSSYERRVNSAKSEARRLQFEVASMTSSGGLWV